MFKRKSKEEIDVAIKSINKMYLETISKKNMIEKIYLEAKRNGFIGPINRLDFQNILEWQVGKKDVWFLMKMELYEKFCLFEMLNKKQLKLKNIIDGLGKTLDMLKVYTDNTLEAISLSGQIKK